MRKKQYYASWTEMECVVITSDINSVAQSLILTY